MDSQGKTKRKGEKGVDKGKVRQTNRRDAGWGLAEYIEARWGHAHERQDKDILHKMRAECRCSIYVEDMQGHFTHNPGQEYSELRQN